MILGLFPALGGVGGIQQVSRHAGAALCELAGRKNEECELLALNDRAEEGWFQVGAQSYRFRGFSRHKGRFVAHLMSRASKTRCLFANHIHFGPPAMVAAALAPRMRYWLVAHGFEVWQPLPLYRALPLRKAHGVVAVSRNTAEAVAKVQNVPPEKVTVLPLALDPDGLPSLDGESAVPAAPSGKRTLLTVARLSSTEPGKGVDTVIRTLPHLVASLPDLQYVIVGDGDGRRGLEDLATELDVARNVVFAGECPGGGLRRYYEAADIFVMPSRQEGFGIVYLEAMAAGKPVIASPCGGAPEVVSDGEDGFLVEYGNVPALAARLSELLDNDLLRSQMGETGRRKVQNHHQFPQFRDRLIALLENGDSAST